MAKAIIGTGSRPLICTPLVGMNMTLLGLELNKIIDKKPDLIEWRADFFTEIGNAGEVVKTAQQLKANAGEIPLIFTIRSVREGGNPTTLSSKKVIDLITAICRSTDVEYVDCELSNRSEDIQKLCRIASENNTGVIASFHDFTQTPGRETLLAKFEQAKNYGADVAKVAVMSKNLTDVLTLLDVTLEAKNTVDIPIITVSMGKYGILSRVFGGVFGSAVTFAVGQSSSAPGQIPIEDLRTVLDIVYKSVGGKETIEYLTNIYDLELGEPRSLACSK